MYSKSRILNIGTIEPVMVLLGDVTQVQIKSLGATLLGQYPSGIETDSISTWLSFENMYKMDEAKLTIEQGELNEKH